MVEWLRGYGNTAMFFGFFITSCVLAYCPPAVKIAVFSAFLLLVFVLFIRRVFAKILHGDRLLRSSLIRLFGGIMAAAVVSEIAFGVCFARIDKAAGKSENARIYIIECEKSYPYITYYRAEIIESAFLPSKTDIILTIPYGDLYNGDEITAEVEYHSVGENNTATFDGRQYYLPKGVMLLSTAEDCEVIGNTPHFSVRSLSAGLRTWLSSHIRAHCSDDSGSLAAAVLLGDKTELPQSVTRDFRRLGISHLLVISGTHFSIILSVIDGIMRRRIRLRPVSRSCVNIGFSLAFMFLTGFTPSVVRAGIMHIIAQLASIVSRRKNTVNAYAFSGAVISFFSPFTVLDVGFQMSYVATFACIVFLTNRGRIVDTLLPFLKRDRKDKGKIRSVLGKISRGVVNSAFLTFTVTMYMLPLSWLYFGEISLVSVITNIVAVPLITLLIYMTAVYLVLYPFFIFIVPLSKLLDVYAKAILSLFSAVSRIKGVIVSVDYGFTVFFVIPLTVLLIILPLWKNRSRVYAAAGGVFSAFVVTVVIANIVSSSGNAVTYIPKGSNDGLVIRSGGEVLVADMSSGSLGYSYALTDEVKNMNMTEIDTVILTHYHNKHISFFGGLCEREIVSTLVLPEAQTDGERVIYNVLCDTAEEYGVSVVTLGADETYSFGEADVRIYPRTYLTRSSHPISGVAACCGGEEFVLVSASWNESESDIAEDIADAGYVFFGEHSPKYKKGFDVKFSGDVKCVTVGEGAREYMNVADDGLTDGVIREREVVRWSN